MPGSRAARALPFNATLRDWFQTGAHPASPPIWTVGNAPASLTRGTQIGSFLIPMSPGFAE
jgi:hypothetical protein